MYLKKKRKKTLYEGVANPLCHLYQQCKLCDFTKMYNLTFFVFNNVTADCKKAYYLAESEDYKGITMNRCSL